MITGSNRLDGFEWCVTPFAQHLDVLKEVVYTMRFDKASAQLEDAQEPLGADAIGVPFPICLTFDPEFTHNIKE